MLVEQKLKMEVLTQPCPFYHPFSPKTFPLELLGEDHERPRPSHGLEGLHIPTHSPDILFICFRIVIFVRMWDIFSFFERFSPKFKKHAIVQSSTDVIQTFFTGVRTALQIVL